ncbi:uncharacterized protein LOC109854694 [Pseudomyrmex gracilis]|uniref:uncharacterized protein LOC109854694 n=1 Tax=Pseudomyrmex gracilis TaxID=219809 RepID=UPI000995A687|nr:uncharacterized protein LOC109854694 [Pseudomyrmex gracilis]
MQNAVEFITLELRPRLRSCNVFIAMRDDVCSKNVRIKILESNIVLTLKDHSVSFSLPSVKVIPTSLSVLSVMSNWICFRLQTAPLDTVFGSFNTEVVTDSEIRSEVRSNVVCSPPVLEDLKLLCKTSECVMLCACCKNVISKSISFKRFLPVPDTDYDPNEWFCCNHNSNITATDLQPRDSDYLYTSCFSLMHKSIFKSTAYLDNGTLTCGKCLLHIGTLYKNGLYKIWNCCVDHEAQSDTSSPSTVNATDPLNDFLLLVRDSLSEILGEEIVLQTCVGRQSHCLLIKPMDHKLNLITEPSRKIPGDTDTILLQQKCVTKVLYKYETSRVSAAVTVNYSTTKYYEVGLPIIEAGLKYLLLSTKRLPHVYRTVVTDYFLGYIVSQEVN